MPVRRGQDRRVLYDKDDVAQVIAIQRTYFEESNPLISTPITPLFLIRQSLADALASQTNLPPIGTVRCLRKASACLPNPANANGESKFQVVLPWHPLTGQLINHLREISAFPGVGSVSYEGESAGDGC